MGCGAGVLLNALADEGFSDLHGVDLFIEKDLVTRSGVEIKKGEIFDITDKTYNVITLFHSLEHMPLQKETITQIEKLLKPDGTCVIAIPIATYAWERYRTNWYQLDAPRHFFLHTEKSFRVLLEDTGLVLQDIIYDSIPLTLILSGYREQAEKRGGKRTFMQRAVGKLTRSFAFKSKTARLNKTGKGDQAMFVIKKR